MRASQMRQGDAGGFMRGVAARWGRHTARSCGGKGEPGGRAVSGGGVQPGRSEGLKSARGAERGPQALIRAAQKELGKWWMCREM